MGGLGAFSLTLDGGYSHGKEEKRQESSEEKEKEESSKESEEEVVEEIREEKSGRPKKGKAQEESGQESCGEAGSAADGNGSSSAVHGGNARGENRPEPRSRLALSDGFQALSGLRMNCGQSGALRFGLNRRHSVTDGAIERTRGETEGGTGAMSTTGLRQDLLDQFRRLAAIFHHGLAFIGLAAVVIILVRGKTLFLDETPGRAAAVGSIRYDGTVSLLERVDSADGEKYQALISYVSRRYRIAPDVIEQFVSAAHEAGRQVGLDPLLILAVMAVESRFNPVAESLVGAKGLMQVVPRHHLDKLLEHGGEEAVLDPMINIPVGARILKEYIRRTGSVEAGLQFYNGSLADPSIRYAQKVIAERERLQQAVRRFGRSGARSSI